MKMDPKTIKVAIITASDKGFAGEREDLSGPAIQEMMEEKGFTVTGITLTSDDPDMLKEAMINLADNEGADIILTTGGTGFTSRDNTPDATRSVVDRDAPGFPEAMRAESIRITPRGMLSRGTAGIRGRTLIINLPGSVKAVKECLAVIIDALQHAVEMINDGQNCAERFNG